MPNEIYILGTILPLICAILSLCVFFIPDTILCTPVELFAANYKDLDQIFPCYLNKLETFEDALLQKRSKWLADLPTPMTYQPIYPTYLPDLPTHPDNLPEPKDNLPKPTDNLAESTDNLLVLRFSE